MNNSDKVQYQQQQQQQKIRQKPGLDFSSQTLDMGISLQNKNLQPLKPSTAAPIESPLSAFYATQRLMGFPPHDFQANKPSLGNRYINTRSQTQPSNYPSRESSFVESTTEQAELGNTLQSFVKCHCYGHQNKNCSQKSNTTPYRNTNQGNSFLRFQDGCLIEDDVSVIRKQLTVPSEGFQDHKGHPSSSTYSFVQPGLSPQQQQEKKYPSIASLGAAASSGLTARAVACKTRIRWTQDLHQKFVESVNCLGGAEKATPKAILKLMHTEGLTIFHVKSHLQKHRMAKYMPDSAEGKSETICSMNDSPKLDEKSGLQIKEALQLQLDVQRQLHEQLEVQRNLQLRIEEQGRQLKMMFELQQKQKSLLGHQNSDHGLSPPPDPPFSPQDDEVSSAKGSQNTRFPSKIS